MTRKKHHPVNKAERLEIEKRKKAKRTNLKSTETEDVAEHIQDFSLEYIGQIDEPALRATP